MAITINGTGSITGLTAGGLPDGSVTADDLAANAVTSEKIAADAVTSGKIASGTIVDADVNASAAIADSKLTGTTCKAWVNFDGTLVTNPGSTTGISASYNVSSVTDNGVGNYTVNFTTAMADANYCSQVSSNFGGASGWLEVGTTKTVSAVSVTTTVHVSFTGDGRNAADYSSINVAIFR